MITLEDLNKLDDVKFEKLVKTLLLLVIGNGITPFSKGKDGAREATFVGRAEYPSKIDNWDGNWIFQVKFSDLSLGIDKARNHIKYSIGSELKKLAEYGYLSSNKCNNYIYITNVPFSGEVEKGLHDYILNKRKTFKVKNFDYWDGEKIIAFINRHPEIRETFFSFEGMNAFDETNIIEIKNYFVKPIQYSTIKNNLVANKIINIVGQAHVGKTCMSIFLASEIFEEKQLSSIKLVPIIDNLTSIPKIKNSVIIFDDLYGDINYDTIGKKTKIINTLQRDNYIIITSRDYIFKEAENNLETFNCKDINIKINQEGAYSNESLQQILKNHLIINLKRLNRYNELLTYLLKNSLYIVNQLRFPHNLQLFAAIIDEQTTNRKILDLKISKAKKIEEVIQSWLIPQTEKNKNILLALSIGKIQNVDILLTICQTQWQYNIKDINNCLTENKRIINFKEGIIRFLHPSFKSAITSFVTHVNKHVLSKLIINLISDPYYMQKRVLYKNLAYSLISDLDSEQLTQLILNQNVPKNFIESCWYNLLKQDRDQAISLLIELHKKDKKGYNRYFSSLVSTKDFMKNKEIFELVKYLLSRRHESKVVDQLIVHFCFRIKSRIITIIDTINSNNNIKDIKLKIKLFGIIGTSIPQNVFLELITELKNKNGSARTTVYSTLNLLSERYNKKVIEILENAKILETNEKIVKKITRSIKHRKSKIKSQQSLHNTKSK